MKKEATSTRCMEQGEGNEPGTPGPGSIIS